MTEKQENELLSAVIELKNQISYMDKKFDSKFESMDERFESIDERFEAIDKRFESIDERFEAMEQKFNNKFDSMQDEIDSISRSVARMEVEHGEKIQLLLDGQISILEKLDLFEKRFKSHETALENHSNRIWNLESKVGII